MILVSTLGFVTLGYLYTFYTVCCLLEVPVVPALRGFRTSFTIGSDHASPGKHDYPNWLTRPRFS